jgi:phosphohistidine phosphatase
MNLYIIRHGIAADLGTAGVYKDHQRPLTDVGRKKMRVIARGLRACNVQLNQILSSPYLRARETAKILADEFKMKDRLAFSENLVPIGSADELIAEITQKYPLDSLALVGHEPSLSALISFLLTGQPTASIMMKKGGVCCLTMTDMRLPGSATLEWLLTPAQLVKLGE